jgi:hypothetical protein
MQYIEFQNTAVLILAVACVAMLIANLRWQLLGRWWFTLACGACGVLPTVLLAYVLFRSDTAAPWFLGGLLVIGRNLIALLTLGLAGVFVIAAIRSRRKPRTA